MAHNIDDLYQFTGETWHDMDIIETEIISDAYVKNLRFMQEVKDLYEEIEIEYYVYEEIGSHVFKIHKTRKALVKKSF